MKNILVQCVKESFYNYTKFPIEDDIVQGIITVNLQSMFGTDPVPDSLVVSAAPWGGTVNGAITAYRNNAQTLGRKNYKGKQNQRK